MYATLGWNAKKWRPNEEDDSGEYPEGNKINNEDARFTLVMNKVVQRVMATWVFVEACSRAVRTMERPLSTSA
jgi:hypothetical protein